MPIILNPDISVSSDPFEQLRSAYALSLLCRRRARPGDNVIDPTVTYGWWGDTYPDVDGDEWGSRLWTLIGRPMGVALAEAPAMVQEALLWAIEDKHVTANEVKVEALGPHVLGVHVTGTLPSGEVLPILAPWYTVV